MYHKTMCISSKCTVNWWIIWHYSAGCVLSLSDWIKRTGSDYNGVFLSENGNLVEIPIDYCYTGRIDKKIRSSGLCGLHERAIIHYLTESWICWRECLVKVVQMKLVTRLRLSPCMGSSASSPAYLTGHSLGRKFKTHKIQK